MHRILLTALTALVGAAAPAANAASDWYSRRRSRIPAAGDPDDRESGRSCGQAWNDVLEFEREG